ncbi:ATPase 9, plasma membrane-type-like [Solanum dulcamara]|uniref:ATPase 9, plasma membrane-type-like n=1 Tax=Solanum dulcamara TaxID=45834 RepID=UPI0024852979|nr:ATPase 9, plasma membrane-type-like [Solanum dulcamara]
MACHCFLFSPISDNLITVYAEWDFARIHGIVWGWAAIIWIYTIITYLPLVVLKFISCYALSDDAWDSMIQNKTTFTTKKDYGKGEREAQWASWGSMYTSQSPRLQKAMDYFMIRATGN